MKKFKSETGMSILEIVIAMGLLGGLALAGMNLFKNQSRSQKTVEKNFEVAAELELMRGILARPLNCKQTFIAGVNPAGGTITTLKKVRVDNVTYDDMYQVNTSLSSGVMVTGYTLDKTATNLAPDETNLRVFFSRGKGTIKEDITKFIKIIYTLSGTNIDTCFAVTSREEIWKRSILDPTDIFYTGGQVGIGTDTPGRLLEVAGDTQINGNLRICEGNANGCGIRVSDDGGFYDDNDGWIRYKGAGPSTTGLRIEGTSNNLEVDGTIKAGLKSIGSSCSPEGAMAYDIAAHRPIFCSQTLVWQLFNAGAGACRFCYHACGGDYPNYGGTKTNVGDWGMWHMYTGPNCTLPVQHMWDNFNLCCQ